MKWPERLHLYVLPTKEAYVRIPQGVHCAAEQLQPPPEVRLQLLRRELEAARGRGATLVRLEHDRDALLESYAGMAAEALEDPDPEERRRIYKLLRLGVRFRPGWPLEITGVFMDLAEEEESGLSYRKLSPLSV